MGGICNDVDGDDFGTGDTSYCTYSSVDCNDSDDEIHPLENNTELYIINNLTVCTATYSNASVDFKGGADEILDFNGSVSIGKASGMGLLYDDDNSQSIVKDGTFKNFTCFCFYFSCKLSFKIKTSKTRCRSRTC